MSLANWRRKEEWKREGRDFLIVVSRHEAELMREYDGEGPHRWCVYAYIYPKHPLFARFDGTEDMNQDAAASLPLHCGPSFCRKHLDADGNVTSYQVGADYSHLHDNRFTHYGTPQDASEVFDDADWLFTRLENEADAMLKEAKA